MPSEKAKEILIRHFNERSIFNIKNAIKRGYDNALTEAFQKFSDELKANNELIDEASLRKRFEDFGNGKLFDDNINNLRKFFPNEETPKTSDFYNDLTERAKNIFFKHLNDDNLRRYSELADEGDQMAFKKVFINLIRELKEKNEKIKGAHIVNRMLEYGVNPEHWNDQLDSVKIMIEDLEGKKAEPFYDKELEDLAKEVSESLLPQEISKEKIEESEKEQKTRLQTDRFIKMHLKLSTQLRDFENHILKRALEEPNKENEIKKIANIQTYLEEDEKQKLSRRINELTSLVDVEKSFITFLQEIATIDEIDHDKVSIIPVEGEVEGRKYKFPAIRVPFKIDFETLKKHLNNEVYSSKSTPYFVNDENANELIVRNSFFEKELVVDKNGLTFNLDIEPERRLSRHTERLSLFKKLIHPEK
jgi:hypothetical protein